MIDNMEQGTGAILMQGGRSGVWYTANDGPPQGTMQSPLPGTPCIPEPIPGGGAQCDKLAQHTHGGGATWALLGFRLSGGPYDASAYQGITFRAMGQAGALRVQFPTSATLPVNASGTCVTLCDDHAFETIAISPSWQVYQVPFTAVHQEGWGTPVPFDPHTILSIWFEADPAASYDFWLDDISFY
jgi:hypothetical protein